MSSRTRTFTSGTSTHAYEQETFDLDAYSDEDLEQMLFQDEEDGKKKSPYLNLPTLAGLSMMLVGILYVLQEIGLSLGPNLLDLVQVLPLIGGVLILALGFGLIGRPRKKKIVRNRKKARTAPPPLHTHRSEGRSTHETGRIVQDRPQKRLKKSRDRKIFGVAGGIAEYFGWDPTLVRVGFIVGALVTQGIAVPLYLALAFFLPKPEAMTLEERIRVIRDS